MNNDEKMIEDQPITMGQPLSDFLLQLEDYTPTVTFSSNFYYQYFNVFTLDSRCCYYILHEKFRF